MKLSEQLRQDSNSGDFGRGLEGYAERAEALEKDSERLNFLLNQTNFGRSKSPLKAAFSFMRWCEKSVVIAAIDESMAQQ